VATEGLVGAVTLQWHSPLVLLQSGSKPLLTSQLHGPHVGCPHQPRGQGWSILQRGPGRRELTLPLPSGTALGGPSAHSPDLTVWPKVIWGTLAAVAVRSTGLAGTHRLVLTWVQVTHISTVVTIVTWERRTRRVQSPLSPALSSIQRALIPFLLL
jgi:hypothetical protein